MYRLCPHLYIIYICLYSLNAVREICTRCPLAMNADLLEDLTRYKQYKERSVMMAAQSLIGTFRRINPDLLRKKDRGRITEAAVMIKSSKYGEIKATEFIPGAEVLYNQEAESAEETNNNDEEVSENIKLFHDCNYHYYFTT